jgi:hypothetical protein
MRRLLRKSWAVAIGVLVFGAVTTAFADSAVIVGAGEVGTWTTTGYVANPNASTDTLIVTYAPIRCQALTGCPPAFVLGPLGSAFMVAAAFGEFGTFYVTQQESSPPPFPLVRASFATSTAPVRSVDIPVVLLSRLMSANISKLNFGGITDASPPPCAFPTVCYAPHSTLVLGNIQRDDGGPAEDLPVELDLFDPSGILVGSAPLTIPYGETALIGNVARYIGEASPGGGPLGFAGQLRVTRTSGNALMWGIVYTTAVDGAVTASAGVNLSP